MGLADTQAIARIRVDPSNPDIVYVAALGHPYGPNSERGVFRSRDGGKNWNKVLYKNDRAGAVDLCLDPHNSRVLFAIIWDVYRTSWTLSSGGPASGLYKSTDGGDTWTEITHRPGLPSGIIGKIGVAVSGADSNRVWAMVEAEDGGLFRSDDGGLKWARVNEDRRLRQRAFYYTRIYADPKDKETVYILNTGFYKSTDGGESGYIAPHPKDPNLFYAGSQGALLTRFERNTGHVRDIQVYPLFFSGMPARDLKERWQWTFPIVFSPLDASVLYTSSQHLWRTTDDGQSWERISPDLTLADPKTLGDSV